MLKSPMIYVLLFGSSEEMVISEAMVKLSTLISALRLYTNPTVIMSLGVFTNPTVIMPLGVFTNPTVIMPLGVFKSAS